MLKETEVISRLLAPLTAGETGAFALSDDGAHLSVRADRLLFVTTDTMVSGVHFLPNSRASDIASKLVRVNVSDAVSALAEPWRYFLNLTLPSWIDDAWLQEFVDSLSQEQQRYHMVLAGGDMTSSVSDLVVSMTLLAHRKDTIVARHHARVGDDIYVTGCLGDAAAGLSLLSQGYELGHDDDTDYLIQRHRRPDPRIETIAMLSGHIHAAMDVSDGLVTDCEKMMKASNHTAVIEVSAIPLSLAMERSVDSDQAEYWALSGGDDYELLFTASPDQHPYIMHHMARIGCRVSVIGKVESRHKDQSWVMVMKNNEIISADFTGFDHRSCNHRGVI